MLTNTQKIYNLTFASVYPLYVNKVERKGRSIAELNEIIFWLTGYNENDLQKHIEAKNTFEIFFAQAPQLHPNSTKITGVICGYRIEEIEDELVKKVRYLDKLVDELAKGRTMEKILRK
jgi:hypothetical protein